MEGLGGSRGGPEFLLDSGGGTLGRGGGGFLGGDLGTGKVEKKGSRMTIIKSSSTCSARD